LSSLANDILDLSALESLSFTLVPVRLKINQLIKEISSVFKLIVESKGIDFVIRNPENMPDVEIDGKRLRQILINIIGNAVKFTEKGGVAITVDMDCSRSGKYECDLIFKITDTGVGIKLADQSRIFREFEQESGLTHRKFGGSGLGLSIVTQLLELMGGIIHLQSEVGVGSSFTVTFLNVPILDGEEHSCNSVVESDGSDSDYIDAGAVSPVLSTREVGLQSTNNDFLNLSEDLINILKVTFGERFKKLSKGINIELINSIDADLQSWSENLNDRELISFTANFTKAAASIKIVDLMKIATLLSNESKS
jgi:hypothetical protein